MDARYNLLHVCLLQIWYRKCDLVGQNGDSFGSYEGSPRHHSPRICQDELLDPVGMPQPEVKTFDPHLLVDDLWWWWSRPRCQDAATWSQMVFSDSLNNFFALQCKLLSCKFLTMCWTLLLWSMVVMMNVSMITMMIMKTMMMT